MSLLLNVIRLIMNRKKRSIYCIVKRLSHLLKYKLILNEEFVSKFTRAREIKNKQRDDEQFINKDISLNVSIKYFNIINRRDANFINKINFN